MDMCERILKAIDFATEYHKGQVRKGTTAPYIIHPVETMDILASMGADTDLLIAGLLHDTLEDTEATATEIHQLFGADVAALVLSHSEDKSKPWEERKTDTIELLKRSSTRAKMLVLADKVSNLRSMYSDYQKVGDKLWERFNAPIEKQAWYYSQIIDVLLDMQDNLQAQDAYQELKTLYARVFSNL